MKPNDFSTIDGEAWRHALTEARKRRKSQGKRVREAIKQAAECAEALNDIADMLDLPTGCSPHDVVKAAAARLALTPPKT